MERRGGDGELPDTRRPSYVEGKLIEQADQLRNEESVEAIIRKRSLDGESTIKPLHQPDAELSLQHSNQDVRTLRHLPQIRQEKAGGTCQIVGE